MTPQPNHSETASDTETKPRPGLYIRTFGCQMNEYDSEKFVSLLSSTHKRVERAEDAEVVIINTCSVREKAESRLYGVLGTLQSLKKEKPGMIIGVGGCVAQQEGRRIVERNKAVDFVVGTHNISLLPSLISRVRNGAGPQVAVDYRDEWEELPLEFESLPASESELFPRPVRALVAIQRGCNKKCAFCVVPTTRGPEVSRPAEEIEREVRAKVRMGAREVLLLGQTVNSYGRDLTPRFPFHRLIERLANIDGLYRIRFTSPHPAEVRREFIDLYGSVPQLCPHIHLPLQSGSDRILQLMNRNYRTKRYLEIVDQLRDRVPHIALTTDVIVGFPTESEEEFESTLEMLRRVRYYSAYSFIYSRRPNTDAALSFSEREHISELVGRTRLQELQRLQDEISQEINGKKIGEQVEVLVEGPSTHISSLMRGRIPHSTLTEVAGIGLSPGDLVKVRVEHAGAHGLRGTVCE